MRPMYKHDAVRARRLVSVALVGLCSSAALSCGEPETAALEVALELEVPDGGDGDVCYQVCTGHTLLGEDSELTRSRCRTDTGADCSTLDATRRLRVVAAYGELELKRGATLDSASYEVLLDGAPTPPSGKTLRPFVHEGKTFAASAGFPVPATAALAMSVRVDGGGGFLADTPPNIRVIEPTLTLEVSQCEEPSNCALPRAGSANVVITGPANLSESTAIIETWLDGVFTVQPPEPFMPMHRNTNQATRALMVPLSGSEWTIAARVGTVRAPSVDITLTNPDVDLAVDGCGDGDCQKLHGEQVELTVKVPREVTATEAIVRTTVDGVSAVGATVTLGSAVGDERTGTATINAPPSGVAWVVGGYVGTAVLPPTVVSLAPPEIDLEVVGCTQEPCSVVQGAGRPVFRLTVPRQVTASAARLETTVDGLPSGDFEVKLTRTEGSVRMGEQVLVAPSSGREWVVTARVGTESADQVLATLSAPELPLTVDGCSGSDPCTLSAGVGSARFVVETPPELAGETLQLSSSVDGAAGSSGSQIIGGGASTAITMPTPPFGRTWEVGGRVGSFQVTPLRVVLEPPEINLEIPACPESGPCELEVGATVAVTATAPARVQTSTGTLRAFVNGLPRPGTTSVNLGNAVGDIRRETVFLTAPAEEGVVWQVFFQLGLYETFAPPVHIVALGDDAGTE